MVAVGHALQTPVQTAHVKDGAHEKPDHKDQQRENKKGTGNEVQHQLCLLNDVRR